MSMPPQAIIPRCRVGWRSLVATGLDTSPILFLRILFREKRSRFVAEHYLTASSRPKHSRYHHNLWLQSLVVFAKDCMTASSFQLITKIFLAHIRASNTYYIFCIMSTVVNCGLPKYVLGASIEAPWCPFDA